MGLGVYCRDATDNIEELDLPDGMGDAASTQGVRAACHMRMHGCS